MSVLHGKRVARRINRKRAGLGFLNERRKKKAELVGFQDASLKYHRPSTPDVRPTVRRELYWNPPGPGFATRRPPLKQARTARGWTIFNGIVVYHESELEHRVSLRIQSRNDVAQLHSQFPVFSFTDAEGKCHRHTADFYVVYKDGFRQAILVKHENKREEMLALIERIKLHSSSAQVDGIHLLTEKYGSIDAFENASFILWSRRHHDEQQADILLELVFGMPERFRFGELLRNCECRRQRRVALWRLIDLGILIPLTDGKIDELTWLAKCPTR